VGSFYALGISIRRDKLRGVVIDVDGEIARIGEAVAIRTRAPASLVRPLERTDVDAVVRGIAALVRELSSLDPAFRNALGLGVELSGHIDGRTGEVRSSLRMGWREPVELAERLEAETGYRTLVEHDVKALAAAEQIWGKIEQRSFAVVTVGHGIGCGLVVDGSLVRGASGIAAELGHMVLESDGRPCVCGNLGCLETVAGDDAILASLGEAGRHADDIRAAARLAQSGDGVARRAFERAGAALGVGLSWLVNLLNLELIILRGEPAMLGYGPYIEAARAALNKHSFLGAADECQLLIRHREPELGARCVASMVFELQSDLLAELRERQREGW
jgi:predicted NBD/HSP70 family sugar kinase